jgi:AraC-like DNA-binding protein
MQIISTGDVPARERLSYLHDYVASRIAGLRFTPRDPASFDYRLATESLGGGMLLARTSYSAVEGSRSGLLSDGRGNYVLSIHDTDYEVEAAGKCWTVRAGDVMIVDESSPYAFRLPGTASRIVSLDRDRIVKAAPSIVGRPAHHFSAATPRAALLSGYIDLLLNTRRDDDGDMLAAHVYDLVANILATAAEPAERTRGRVAEARLAMVKADIDERLTDATLTIARLARRHHVTPRYIQQLFARQGTSFSDFVRDRRLDEALHRLRDTADARSAISTIAFDTGFGDLSSFNRAFRKRFGSTPSDIRAQTIERHRADL